MSLGKMPKGWWSQDTSLEQSMQVSMATLTVAAMRYYHTESQWRYLPPHILTIANEREGGERGKALNRHEWHLKANCTFAHSWQAKHVSLAKPCMKLYRA